MESTPDDPSDADGITILECIDEFVNSGSMSANYRSNALSILTQPSDVADEGFAEFCEARGVTAMDDLDPHTLSKYAQHLNRRHQAQTNPDTDGGISANTVWTYFDTVSAFLDHAHSWEWIDDNYAQKERVKHKLPSRPKTDSRDQQFWSPESRKTLIDFVDQRVESAIDEKGLDAVVELRDRALVYLIAYSGARGGEILSDPKDDRRNGLTWADVDIENSTMTVLGKNQSTEQVQLPRQVHTPLLQLKRAIDPPTDEWPVIPTQHAPSIYSVLPDAYTPPSDGEMGPLDYCKQTDTIPPSLSTNGARSLMKRLCEQADVSIDGEYLKPHGGRRGLGEKLYKERGAAAAQRTLRHADPETTSKMYSHIESSELADDVGDVFDDE